MDINTMLAKSIQRLINKTNEIIIINFYKLKKVAIPFKHGKYG